MLKVDRIHKQTYLDCIRYLTGLMELLEYRVPHLRGRAVRIDNACRIIGAELALDPSDLLLLVLAARFHDVGLLGVPDVIINKPAQLTEDEMAQFLSHTDLGGRMISKLFPDIPALAEIVWRHHERPDGKGQYGLRQGKIPPIAAVINVVQAIEAMVNDRPFRSALPREQIMSQLEQNRGTQFDPTIVDAFLAHADAVCDALRATPITKSPVANTGPMLPRTGPSSDAVAGQASASKGRASPALPRAEARSTPAPSGELEPIITKTELLKLVAEGLEIRPLAGTIEAVMAVTSNARCTADEVARAISKDQALSIRLLKLASSTTYSRGHSVENLKDAVQRIGIMEVRNVAMTLNVLHSYQGRIAEYVDPWLFWEHSIACGVLATHIARACRSTRTDNFFLWGVLHDVGRLILIDHLPNQYAQVWETANARDQRLEVIEEKLLTINHCEILRQALEHWHFPQEIIVPVVNHHASASNIKRLGTAHADSAAAIALADRVAHAMLMGSSGNEVVYPFEDVADLLKLSPEKMNSILEAAPNETNELKAMMLARGDHDACPDHASQLREKLAKPIRPLCVSVRTGFDAYRLFCQRLADMTSSEPLNIGVIYLTDVRELDGLISAFQAGEKQEGVSELPVVIVKAKGKVNPDHAWLKSRRVAILDAPTRMIALIDEFNRLLA